MLVFQRLLIGVVFAWGLLALVVRSLTPLIGDWRPQIEAALGDRLGARVTIASIDARWFGLHPLIELSAISLGEGDDALSIDRAMIELSPLGIGRLLLGQGRNALTDGIRLTLDGLAVTVVREADDRIHLGGIGPIGDGIEPPVPNHLQLVNTEVLWIDRKRALPPVSIPKVAVQVVRDGADLAIRARVESDAGHADASARLSGYLGTTEWSGESYLRATNLDAARLFAPYLPTHYGLSQLSLNIETWTRWEDAVPVHSQGELSLHDLQLEALGKEHAELSIDAVSAGFSLTRQSGAPFRLGLRGLRLAMADRVWPTTDIALSLWRGDAGISLDLYAEHLELQELHSLVDVRLPQHEASDALQGLAPRGRVRDLRLQLDTRNATPRWRMAADLEGLNTDSWQDVPALQGISGSLNASHGIAQLTLDSRNSQVRFDELFREPLVLDRISGDLVVHYDAGGWSLRSDRIVIDTPDLKTETRVVLRQAPNESLFIDLQTDFRDGDGGQASRYYPVSIMGPPLVRWLDRSIQGGRVVAGSALVYGPVDEFAFEKTRSGSFQVIFDVTGVDIDYKPGWPALNDIDGRVRFHGNQLDISSHAARIYDSTVERVDAHIAALQPISPIEIRGRVVGPLANHLRVLREDGLRERFGRFAEGVRGQGNAGLELDFAIPLSQRRGEYRLDGTIGFDANSLALPDWDLELDDINGTLAFTLDGLSAEDIRAHTLGQAVTIDVATRDNGTTRVTAAANLPVSAIQRQLPSLPLGIALGRSDFEIRVDIPARSASSDTAAQLGIDSSLAGIAIALPAPLGKISEVRQALELRLPLDASKAGTLRYGDVIAARFSTDGKHIAVNLGADIPEQPHDTGIVIAGQTPVLDVAAWHAALRDLPESDPRQLPPMSITIDIDRLLTPALNLDGASLAATHRDSAWAIELDSTQLAGRASVPAELPAQPVVIALDRLALDLPLAESSGVTPLPDPSKAMDPGDLPAIDLSVGALSINQADLGALALRTQRTGMGLALTEFKLHGGAAEATATGSWSRDGGQIESTLTADVRTGALGDLLVDLGYARQLEEGPAAVDLQLSWPGDPGQIHRGTVDGLAGIAIEGGRLVELDPGVTRVVGLLNLNALARRLRLDFSDLFKKGYSFDSVVGTFDFASGVASTDDLTVVGPSGRIELSGTTNLLERTLDQQVRVTPDFDATLPIASTIAGGPIAGVAVLVAQQVLADQVDDINRFEYRVTGPWTEPEIEQLDSGGALSRVLKAPDSPDSQDPPVDETAVSPATPTGTGDSSTPPEYDAATPAAETTGLPERLRDLLDKIRSGGKDAAESPVQPN